MGCSDARPHSDAAAISMGRPRHFDGRRSQAPVPGNPNPVAGHCYVRAEAFSHVVLRQATLRRLKVAALRPAPDRRSTPTLRHSVRQSKTLRLLAHAIEGSRPTSGGRCTAARRVVLLGRSEWPQDGGRVDQDHLAVRPRPPERSHPLVLGMIPERSRCFDGRELDHRRYWAKPGTFDLMIRDASKAS